MRWLGIADKRTRFDLAVGEILVPVSASDSVWFDRAVGEILVPFRFGLILCCSTSLSFCVIPPPEVCSFCWLSVSPSAGVSARACFVHQTVEVNCLLGLDFVAATLSA